MVFRTHTIHNEPYGPEAFPGAQGRRFQGLSVQRGKECIATLALCNGHEQGGLVVIGPPAIIAFVLIFYNLGLLADYRKLHQ